MKNYKKKRNILLITAISLFLLLSLSMTFTGIIFAAYTNSKNTQRTIATYDTAGERFSSNYLRKENHVSTIFVENEIPVPEPSTTVTVCNYEQGRRSKPYTSALSYEISFRFVKKVGQNYVAANVSEVSEYTVTIEYEYNESDVVIVLDSSRLAYPASEEQVSNNVFDFVAGEARADTFTITLSSNFVTDKPDIYLEMTATPSIDSPFTYIQSVFEAETRSSASFSQQWTGVFEYAQNTLPADHDGFNYVISGSGNGVVTLTWDSTKLSLSHQSVIELMMINGAVKDGDTISFPVNSAEKSRYNVQFYKKNITVETWSDMNGRGKYVYCTFEQENG